MITLAFAVGLLAALYLYLTRTFDYWQKRGVKHDQPWPLFGTNAKNYLMQANFEMMTTEAYKKYPGEKVVGYFRSSTPDLIIRDPVLARRVLVSDFMSFHRRGVFPSKYCLEPLLKNQFTSEDDLWRMLRLRLTPAFSSGKLKAMFPLIVERAEGLQARLKSEVGKNQVIEARDLMARFTTDVIGTVGFGVASDSLNDENDAFRQLGTRLVATNFKRVFKLTLKIVLPMFFGHFKFTGDFEEEVTGMVQTIMKQRNDEPCGRNDFIDLLLECKKKGAMTGDSIVDLNEDGSPKKVSIDMDDAMMAAQSFVFFVAGFETSSSAASYTLHQLAHNPEVQSKAQMEIDRVLAKHDNKLSYDAISEMTYLRWCLDESMRIFPAIGFLQRQCVRPYTFPDTQVSIGPGVNVIIPVQAYQNDPEIFPEPKVFRPERFDPAVLTPQQKMAYMPFGEGPRACVGERLGLMQSMAGLAAVLAQYSVAPVPGAPRDLVVSPHSGAAQSVRGGLPIAFHARNI